MKNFLSLIFILLIVAGCGKGTIPLGGTVAYDDGSPLAIGSVIFSNGTFMASGEIDSQGKYTMGSYSEKDGLPKGTYKVYISGATEEMSGGTLYSLIDPQYGGSSSTPLSCDIPAPKNTFDIKVPKNPQPRPR